MDTEIIEENELVVPKGYALSPKDFFSEKKLPAVGKCLLLSMEKSMEDIETKLCSSPAVVNAIASSIPQEVIQVVFTGEQKKQLASGALKLMTKKDGSLMANLVNPQTNRIVSTAKLEKVQVSPECTQAMSNLAMQMQLAQIAEQIQIVQKAVEEVRIGQENDRLAIAYSCQQRFIQAMSVTNPELKTQLLLGIISDAENSRNQLMLSQKNSIDLLFAQSSNTISKIFSATNVSESDRRLSEIRNSLCTVNMVSLVEAMVYQELGEEEAARLSLNYYESYLVNTYLFDSRIIERLNSLDPSTTGYWKKTVPKIKKAVATLPEKTDILLIGGGD